MELALRLGGVLERYCITYGAGPEELNLIERALKHRAGVTATVQAQALFCAGRMTLIIGNLERAEELARELLALCREQGDQRGCARALAAGNCCGIPQPDS